MKKIFRALLCGAVLTASLCVSAFAAQSDLLISAAPTTLPEKQGDFYVLANGEFVTFTDATPKIKNDRSCLPFVAVFEQLGFAEKDMTWNGETSTVTATKGDLTISLTIGKNEITLIQNGETTVIETDVAPYIEPALSRTYVPFGLVADALGYNVGWDAEVGAVIIDDVDAIMAANTETYELMDKYLAYSQSFSAKNQKVTGSYNMEMAITELAEAEQMDILMGFEGDYNMIITPESAFQFDTDMDLSMEVALNGEDITDAMMSTEEMAAIPETIDFEMRGDLTSGSLYFNSAALCNLLAQPDMANAWFKLDLAGLLGNEDYSNLMSSALTAQDMTFEEALTLILKNTFISSIDATTTDTLAVVNALLGDSAFVKDGTTYINELSLGEIDESGAEATIAFALYTSGSKVNGYGMYLAVEDETALMEVSATMKGTKLEMYMVMDMLTSDTSAATLLMEMDGTYKSTTTKPATEPPAGAVVVDIMDMLTAIE